MFKEVDHIAVIVRNTDNALKFYRDTLGLELIVSEELPDAPIRLTHLDMGNVQLQLVEPLSNDHPLAEHLSKYGEGLHHICWKVDDVEKAMEKLPDFGMTPIVDKPHSGVQGRKAVFINPQDCRNLRFELTSDPEEPESNQP